MTGAPRAAYSGGEFVAVRRDAVTALGSWEAAGVWQRICWRAERTGSWVATIEQIADDVCLTVPKTRTALKAIRAAGWIESSRASGRDRTLRWWPVWSEASGDIRQNVATDSCVTPSSETDRDLPPCSPPVSLQPQLTLVSDDEAQPADLIDAEFEAFWRHWPVKRGRKPALAKYRAARKRGVPMEVIAAGFRAHAPVFAAKVANGDEQFVPHAATWLHQERWDDPAPPMPRHADPYAAVDNPTLLAQSSSYGDPYAGLTGTQPATRSIGGTS